MIDLRLQLRPKRSQYSSTCLAGHIESMVVQINQQEVRMSVFDSAIKMEVDGGAFYQKLAEASNVARLKTIFSRLAEDEQKHLDIFQALKGANTTVAMAATTVLNDAMNIFATLVSSDLPVMPKTDLDAYRYAMDREADGKRFYEEAAAKEHDPNIKKLLLEIAAEEHKHFLVLENLYDFAKAPYLYQGWGKNLPSMM
jgi:rubrerythrin